VNTYYIVCDGSNIGTVVADSPEEALDLAACRFGGGDDTGFFAYLAEDL